MKKTHWFPTVTIAFITICVSSLYGTLSTISVLKKWDNLANGKSRSETEHRPREKIRENAGTMNASSKYNESDAGIRSKHQRLHSDIVHAIQKHVFQVSNTMNNSTDNLRGEPLRVLQVLTTYYSDPFHRLDSDVVELRHCRLDIVDYSKFSSWAAMILLDARSKFEGKLKQDANEVRGFHAKDTWYDSMYLEFSLGLLEMFVTQSSSEDGNSPICDFRIYPLSIQRADLRLVESTLRSVPSDPDRLPRLVFVIVAFQDVDHLEALIEACWMAHHLIIVHLERRSPPSFTDSVHDLTNNYANVVVVQFGTIIYQTDSVSTVNYQIMYWLTAELGQSYDYLLTLGNAAYPLHSARELTNYFQKTKRNIWLGELRNGGGWISWSYLERKRLVFTAGNPKYAQRTKKWKQNGFDSPIPEYIKSNMIEKTNSGNQAVFSYGVVKKLIDSPQVRELFSLAKYGCCSGLEERTWIAAARIIGYGKEAIEAASMFQVWGGKPACGNGSMKNALLLSNATICYKSEDVTKGNIMERQKTSFDNTSDSENPYFRGDKLLEELRMAKDRGFLFARKFKSGDKNSLELVEMIKMKIHNN